MKWGEVVERYARHPLVEPEALYCGQGHPPAIQVQISRWVKEGKLIKLARERYLIAPPCRSVEVPLETLANWLVYPSYVSLEYALSFYTLIPEGVPLVTSVTTRRPQHYRTPVGNFIYHHVKSSLFFGYQTEIISGLACSVATPEKALLDTFYFLTGPITLKRLREMRLQHLDRLDRKRLEALASQSESTKLQRAVSHVFTLMGQPRNQP